MWEAEMSLSRDARALEEALGKISRDPSGDTTDAIEADGPMASKVVSTRSKSAKIIPRFHGKYEGSGRWAKIAARNQSKLKRRQNAKKKVVNGAKAAWLESSNPFAPPRRLL
jgi:hypothetical protein